MKTTKTVLLIVAVAALSIVTGLHLGAKKANRQHHDVDTNIDAHVEATEALSRAKRLYTDLKTVELLRRGETNGALTLLIGQIDYGIVSLAGRPNSALFETNTAAALRMAVSYRKTNSWMQAFELSSEITETARKIVGTN